MPQRDAINELEARPALAGPVRDLPAITVLGLFEAAVAAAPGAPALSCGEQRLSYRELDASAEAAASRLRAAGARPGSRIAVCLDRSADLPTALLAVWKAGGVHVPVDLGYPAERIRFLLADSGADLVLTRSDLAAGLPDLAGSADTSGTSGTSGASGASVVLLDGPPPGVDAAGPTRASGPADPAYVIYTSGSTGLPKGVQIGHGALVNVVLELGREFPCGPGDRWLAMAAAGFDIAMAEFCVPLATGAELVLTTEQQLREPRQLVELIREREVTRMQAVPSQWRLLLDAGFDAPGMVAMVGGESLSPTLARELRSRLGGLRNGYGPTETTVLSTLWRVPREPGSVAIGRPIANTRLHLLDPELRPVADGEVGELCIAGAGVADGYPNRPELTAERFVPEPGGPEGALMYRTGDRCRVRPDGLLEFLGRADDQVKLNGHRIELGEVEAALGTMPGVAGVAVAVHERGGAVGDGGAALVAYVVPEAGAAAPSAAELREFARTRLPAAWTPGLLVTLDAFPLTPHGKLDRAALPTPGAPSVAAATAAATETADVAGNTQVGGLLGEICGLAQEVLGVERVRPEDDLADLGATSLSLMQLAGRMHLHWGVDVPLELLWDSETVAELTAAIAELRAARR